MTVAQILAAARNNLNALTDSFWSDSELYVSLHQCELRLAREARTIENVYSTTSVSGTDEYTKPQRAIEIWRVLYDGKKLQYIDFRQLDTINPNSTTNSGTPSYYSFYDDAFYLYPTPNAAETIMVYSYDEPEVPTANSTLDTPSEYHDALVMGLTAQMCTKETAHPQTVFWQTKWENEVEKIIRFSRRRRRGDRFSVVKDEDCIVTSDFGMV